MFVVENTKFKIRRWWVKNMMFRVEFVCLLRKDGTPRELVAQQGGLGTGKMMCLGNLWLSKVV